MEYIKYERVGVEDTRLLVKYRVQFLIELMGNKPDESINLLSKGLESYFNEFIPLGKYVCWWAKDQDEVVGIEGWRSGLTQVALKTLQVKSAIL